MLISGDNRFPERQQPINAFRAHSLNLIKCSENTGKHLHAQDGYKSK